MEMAAENKAVSSLKKIPAFMELGRAPFLTVIIFPFILGTGIGALLNGGLDVLTFILSFIAVMCITVTSNLLGEYYDFHGDNYGADKGKNKFSGGTLLVKNGVFARKTPLIAGIVMASIAILLGLYVIIFRGGGWQALAMGAAGLIASVFYTAEPIRFAKRGIGEIVIGLSFGLLPVMVGCWLQAHTITAEALWFSLPISLTIFNVILINQFPDYIADKKFDKKNLVIRFGKQASAVIYGIAGILAAVSLFFVVWWLGYPLLAFAVVALPALVATLNSVRVLLGQYKDAAKLEQICGTGIIINILTAAALVAVIFIF